MKLLYVLLRMRLLPGRWQLKRIANCGSSQTVLLFAICWTLCSYPCLAAGPDAVRARLFNGSALAKAEQHRHRGFTNRTVPNFAGEGGGIEQAAELDTVSDILEEHRGGADFFADYRAPFYLTYVYNVVPLGDLEDWDSRNIAEKVLIFQAAHSLSKVLMESALQPLYCQALDAVKWFGDYTSVKVRQEGRGRFQVESGAETGKPLFELKLHVSANNGVEPRLQIGEHFLLRYDLIHDETLVEFRRAF